MFTLNRILKIVFIILLLITTGEIGYYFYIQNNKKVENIKTATDISQPLILISIYPSVPPKPTPTININQAISDNNLKNLKALSKKTVVSSILTTKYKGTISMLDTKGGTISTGIKYKFMLGINSGEDQISFYLNENDLKLAKFMGDKEIGLELSKLKIGDNVFIEEMFDLAKNSDTNLISFKVQKA